MYRAKDKITVTGLKIYAYHGCLLSEKEKGQDFYIDLNIFLNLNDAGKTDELDCTVDYACVCTTVREAFTKKSYDLIEAAAEAVAMAVLKKYSLISSVEVTVHKPNAPIPAEFNDISVNILRTRHRVYVSVGSNLGDSEAIIKEAETKLNKVKGVEIIKESSIITTKAYGLTDQPDFKNAMWIVNTILSPTEFLNVLNRIEADLGRERLVHWGPRTIDLDIVYFDDFVIDTDRLTIPHIDMANREFVLRPLMEVDPYVRHPVTKLRAEDMLNNLSK